MSSPRYSPVMEPVSSGQRLAVDTPYLSYADSVFTKYRDRYEESATEATSTTPDSKSAGRGELRGRV